MSGSLLDTCERVVAGLGYRQSRLYSGAEHDAAVMARLCPTVMLFVPSHQGRSHCPQEWTDGADVLAGVHALAASILAVDAGGGGG
jgi:N-carbamoyl-L-amino-acid hydrolase